MSSRPSIEISFLGGATTIGASCTLVRVADTTLVVDCGVRYSGTSPLPDLAPLAETPIDAVLVTHAHMDHGGGLPVLTEACPAAPVLGTPPTIDLLAILLWIDPPQTETESEGPFYRAAMSLRYQGETVASGPQQAASKKTAEQLAARALLELVSQRAGMAGVTVVGEEELPRLQIANPKGQLLEWCVKNKLSSPQFQQHANPQWYQVRAVIGPGDEQGPRSAWYLASTLKAAEQAAAEEVLRILRSAPPAEQAETLSAEPEQSVNDANAAMAINELKQMGVLQAFGYDATNESGPSHQPVFSVAAWATLPDGQVVRADVVRASSKKAGQRSAAARLLDLLVARGITRR